MFTWRACGLAGLLWLSSQQQVLAACGPLSGAGAFLSRTQWPGRLQRGSGQDVFRHEWALPCAGSGCVCLVAASGTSLSTALARQQKGCCVLQASAGVFSAVRPVGRQSTVFTRAGKGLGFPVDSAVVSQGIAAGKGFQAIRSGADKGPGSRMYPAVVLQGLWVWKGFRTALVRADKGPDP